MNEQRHWFDHSVLRCRKCGWTAKAAIGQPCLGWASSVMHDPGDEDRRPDGPWCERCGDAFEGPERQCPNPALGRPYVDCGRGGHMFTLRDRPR